MQLELTFIPSFAMAADVYGHPINREVVRIHEPLIIDFEHRIYSVNEQISKRKRLSFDFAPEEVIVLPKNWKVISPYCFLLTPDGKIITESFSFPHEKEARTYLENVLEDNPIENHKHVDGALFVYSNVGFDNYYHVFTELIPRLEWYMAFIHQSKLLVPQNSPAFVFDALSALGITSDKIELQHPNTSYSADVLITLPYQLNFIPERYLFLKEHLRKKRHESETSKKILFVSRENEIKRNLVNLDELKPIFKNFAVDLICAEKWTLLEQIEYFSSCRVIVGPHGAGLTNLIWMDKPNVIEIKPAGYANECFKHLALANGADTYVEVEVNYSDAQTMNMRLDPQLLAQVLSDSL